jgi:hypothetical protein
VQAAAGQRDAGCGHSRHRGARTRRQGAPGRRACRADDGRGAQALAALMPQLALPVLVRSQQLPRLQPPARHNRLARFQAHAAVTAAAVLVPLPGTRPDSALMRALVALARPGAVAAGGAAVGRRGRLHHIEVLRDSQDGRGHACSQANRSSRELGPARTGACNDSTRTTAEATNT